MFPKDILGLRLLNASQITTVLDTAEHFRSINQRRIKKVPTLRGRTVMIAFFENSTRTKTSFELAAKRLSADVLSFSACSSATKKGETLMDTARNLDAMQPDAIIMRHPQSGAPHMLAQAFPWSMINAGDGINEHPSQGLLDLLTMRDHLGDLKGKKVAIVGDVYHTRVARSNIYGLRALGAHVIVAGPGTMCPQQLSLMGVELRHHIDEVLVDADVVMMLRIQRERLGRAMMSTSQEYSQFYGLDGKRLQKARSDVLVMHPGPINRGVELMPEVADGANSLILEQVSNGIAVRMALLYLTLGSQGGESGVAI
ncbi:MAG: aspartate carbamoyltransferase catalytic subunit [Myxococcota bacterium]|nr:aspartate carbamoyltransferase catalytic subunit [Myxococcota bacterium]